MKKLGWLALVCVALLFGSMAGCKQAEHALNRVKSSEEAPADGGQATPVAQEAYNDISVRAQDARIPVLMFHDVVPKRTKDTVWFDCTDREFQKILDWIDEEKLTPISLDQLYDHLTGRKPAPANAIVLTFDDNYQGFYDIAYPLLKEKKYPAAMFVHTDFVGSTKGRPKMDWPTLQQLVKEGLVTIGSHTLSHPDLTLLPQPDQQKEISDSKKVLEEKLGIKVDYFAYPDGKNDPISQQCVKDAGYKMAVTVENGPAEESPNIFLVNRYIQTRYEKALEECRTAFDNAPAAIVEQTVKEAPITYKKGIVASVDMSFIFGGRPQTLRSPARQGVLEFMKESQTVAGINGTFFAMAEVNGTSNEMVGPVFTSNEKTWVRDEVPERVAKIRNRPMVVMGPTKIAFFPFCPSMNFEDPIRNFMPDFTDAFVSGVWLVHEGKARTKDELMEFGARDAMQPRHRAFFGTTSDGQIVLGASQDSVSAEKLAEAAVAGGVYEAVMMDSGFSTSLVYGSKVIASGHSTPTEPSRPVPHAIVLAGTLAQDPDTITVPQPEQTTRKKRRKR